MNHSRFKWAFVFFVAFLGSGCAMLRAQVTNSNMSPAFQYVDGILAIIGDKIIIQSEFETQKIELSRGMVIKDTQELFCKVLEMLIVQKLLINQAEIDSLVVTEEEVERDVDNRIRSFQNEAGSLALLEKYLGKSIGEFKKEIRPKIRERILVDQMRSKITSDILISPSEINAFYDSIPLDSLPIIQTQVEVAQCIIEPLISDEANVFAKGQLEELRNRIVRGENFEKLARTYSMDPGSKGNGGILPEFGRGEMSPAFERVAFKLKPDSLSQVFESPNGFHIIKMMKRKGERVLVAHILLRPENTSYDYSIASQRVDSVYQILTNGTMTWCDAVKKYASKEVVGNRGNCGFLVDQTTGIQNSLFESLPSDVKIVVEKMRPGDFSKPTLSNTPDGRSVYRIIFLKSFTSPHQANLLQDYSYIQLLAHSAKRKKIFDQWTDKQRGKTYIRIKGRSMNCSNLNSWNHD